MGLITTDQRMVRGQHTTVAASDDLDTGLREVLFVLVSLDSDPVAGAQNVTATVPSQVTSPGKITIKSWKATATGDTAQTAGTTFSKLVNWLAVGK
jgi:hypothetical protein